MTPWVGNLTDDMSCELNKTSSAVILVPIICWKDSQVTSNDDETVMSPSDNEAPSDVFQSRGGQITACRSDPACDHFLYGPHSYHKNLPAVLVLIYVNVF